MAFEPFVPPAKGWAPSGAGLTERQLVGIASVVTAWAVLETILQHALLALVQSPLTLGQALTEDLAPDNRLKALRRLCATWLIIMRARDSELADAIDELAAIGLWIEQNKGRRNQIAHWQWLRQDDDHAFGFKYSTKPLLDPAKTNTSLLAATEDFAEFAAKIRDKTDEMIDLVRDMRRLPSWPERRP